MNYAPDTETTASTSRRFGEYSLIFLALIVLIWAIVRACHQSITMDEAMTYRAFVSKTLPEQWTPHSNNHILNSLLMRLSILLFGLSQLTVRLPALLGTAIYITSCYYLCRSITEHLAIRIIVFICLTFNPFIADYYAVARGYSLAIGLLTCAVAVIARSHLSRNATSSPSPEHNLMLASALLGLSFVANFTFAFIDAAVWIALLLWTIRATPHPSARSRFRLLAASTIPALAVVFLLAYWTLYRWPRGQFFDGAHSLKETFSTIFAATLHQPSLEMVNPLILNALSAIGPYLIPTILTLAAIQLLLVLRQRRDLQTSTKLNLGLLAIAAPALALAIHWIAFHAFGLFLPHLRTALYIATFTTLAVGTLAAISATGIAARTIRTALVSTLAILAVYFVTCMRVSYISEWWLCADMKDTYYVLAWYNHYYQVDHVSTQAPFTDTMEFYRRASGNESFKEFNEDRPPSSGQKIYAFFESQNRGFIDSEHLKIIYHGPIDSDVVVAIRPDLELTSLAEPRDLHRW